MSGSPILPTASKASDGSAARKTHHRRESSGHICTACDQCYRCKVRCSGERPVCQRCQANNSACTYSTGKPLGKPKGSKNKVQRSKSTNDASKPSIAPAKPPKGDWTGCGAAKRANDGTLPPSKRSNVDILATESSSQLPMQPHPSPTTVSPELAGPPTTMLRTERSNPPQESLPYYSDSLSHHDAVVGFLDHSNMTSLGETFPSADLSLDIDDFNWFTQVGSTPTAVASELQTHDISPAASGPQPLLPPSSTTAWDQDSALTASPDEHTALVHRQPQQTLPCLCDPRSLGIISELHTLQLTLSPLDTALLLARRGLMTVSSYLSCPSCLSQLSNTPSLFLACILILQQVFACYLSVRMQGAKMLHASNDNHASAKQGGAHPAAAVSIGDFEVEGEEPCNRVLEAIVKAEMERGKGILGLLERWVEKAGSKGDDGRERVAGLLLRALREEIGFPAAC